MLFQNALQMIARFSSLKVGTQTIHICLDEECYDGSQFRTGLNLNKCVHYTSCGNTVQKWSCARGILSACEKMPRKQESCDLSIFNNTELSLDYIFMPLPCVVDRSEST